MSLVSLVLAKQHLRVSGTAEDALIGLYLGAAENAAMRYMNRKVYENATAMGAAVLAGTAGTDPMVVEPDIQAAVLLTLGHLYENREDVVPGVSVTDLPKGSQHLLQPYRVEMGI